MNKVAIFKAGLLPYSATFILEQARALRAWHPVLVGTHRVENGLSLDGFDVCVLPVRGSGLLARVFQHARHRLGLPAAPQVVALRALGARLIHAHFGTDAVDVWPMARALGIPMVVTLHGYDVSISGAWWEAGHGRPRRRIYPRRLLAMAHDPAVTFIAVSEALRQRAIARGIPAEKVIVSYIGIDTTRFRPEAPCLSERPRRVLFVGRLVEKKGAAYLVRAYAKVRRAVPDAELVIIGEGPMRKELESLACRLGAPARFLGVLAHEQIRQQLARTRVLCLPSTVAANGDAEGFGMVILEAQACGVPVVTSALGGASEGIIDGATGFRFPETDIDGLAHRLTSLLTNDDLLKTMSRAARDFVVRTFDLRTCTERLEEIYDSAVRRAAC